MKGFDCIFYTILVQEKLIGTLIMLGEAIFTTKLFLIEIWIEEALERCFILECSPLSSQKRNTDSNDRRSERKSTDSIIKREVDVGVEDRVISLINGVNVDC